MIDGLVAFRTGVCWIRATDVVTRTQTPEISLNLLRAFYDEGLVDNRTFLVWLVQQLATCNLAQLGFIARLVNEYLDGMLVTRSITRPFVDVCLGKVSEVLSCDLPAVRMLFCVDSRLSIRLLRPSSGPFCRVQILS